MRLFVAVILPDSLREALLEVRRRMESRVPGVRWVSPGHFHLTLKFLGETPDEQAGRIQEALAQALKTTASFPVEMAGLGVFPSGKSPRVLWAGVREGRDALTRLAERVEGALELIGFPREARSFEAHLTLGRFKSPPRTNGPLLTAEWEQKQFGAFQADQVSLMRSDLKPDGPVYTVVQGYLLKKTNT
ncbi:MAG: RNA 2',3'-cyclic phosphodiesterase [Elusimicrobia bacterium]|nr:RNA 2',3'-cyclic phosphodiesterase [Elusimicrobiota bacterium]